mgnify:CR=1 FL=1
MMKISDTTMDVLKNFSSINQSLAFNKGSTIRTVNELFGQDQSSATANSIIDSTSISTGGSVTSAKQKLKLYGVGSSPDVEMDNVYIMAHKDFSNGRLEIVLSATAESTNQSVLTTS